MTPGKQERTCQHCGRTFRAWPSAVAAYCSHECSGAVAAKTHGESRTRLYQIWLDVKNRCRCSSAPNFAEYGAKGIRVCDEWANSYAVFRDWAYANGYESDLEIDRRNPRGHYEPGNCRWATHSQQMRNTRKRRDARTSRFKGVSWNALGRNWKAQIWESGRTRHLGVFATELQAAFAYDDAAYAIAGEFARINFPERKQSHSTERMEAHVSVIT